MGDTHRVVVTGKDDRGRSIVSEDIEVSEVAAGNFNFWRDDPHGRDGGFSRDTLPFFPREGTVFRFFRIPPEEPGLSQAEIARIAEGFFNAVGDPAARVDTTRHPLMHVTPTLDYIVLLSGSIALLLDTGEPIDLKPFDAVVQRGTNHTWVNRGKEAALLMAVMVGKP
jgi:hypothetical protein